MSNPIPKILIVEHDQTVARDLGERLKYMGYTVSATVEGVREAVEIGADARPDLALVNLGLVGDQTGPEVAELLWPTVRRSRRVPDRRCRGRPV